jgi:hypothetical protein
MLPQCPHRDKHPNGRSTIWTAGHTHSRITPATQTAPVSPGVAARAKIQLAS